MRTIARVLSEKNVSIGDIIRIQGDGVYHLRPEFPDSWNQIGIYCSLPDGDYPVVKIIPSGLEIELFTS